MISQEGMSHEPVSVPMTPMYTPYGHPPIPPGFAQGVYQGPISPGGTGLGALPIKPPSQPRFAVYPLAPQ